MTVGHPWSGRDSNGLPQIFGRAAIPGFPNGGGFNWPSMARTTGWIRPGLRGLGTLRRRGRGLGQDDGSAPGAVNTISASTPGLISSNLNFTDILGMSPYATPAETAALLGSSTDPASAIQGASSSSSTTSNLLAAALAGAVKTGSNIASYELNPLYQKSTFMITPQGTVLATNQPTGIPGLTTATTASLMPLLLIGGVVVMFMMMARR